MKCPVNPKTRIASSKFHVPELRALEKAVRRIVRANDLQSKALSKSCGLTAAQLVVLKGISELGEVTTTVLSAHADLSPATVVTVLDNLEERGIIERYRSMTDRRIVHTRLTASGAGLVAKAPEPLGDTVASRFAALREEQRAALLASADALASLLERAPAVRQAHDRVAQDAPRSST